MGVGPQPICSASRRRALIGASLGVVTVTAIATLLLATRGVHTRVRYPALAFPGPNPGEIHIILLDDRAIGCQLTALTLPETRPEITFELAPTPITGKRISLRPPGLGHLRWPADPFVPALILSHCTEKTLLAQVLGR